MKTEAWLGDPLISVVPLALFPAGPYEKKEGEKPPTKKEEKKKRKAKDNKLGVRSSMLYDFTLGVGGDRSTNKITNDMVQVWLIP